MRISELFFESYEFVAESAADDILTDLKALGFSDTTRDSGKKVSLRVQGDRRETIKDLIKKLPGAVYNPNAGSSSLGGIEFKGGMIQIRPAGKSGTESAGLKNEQHLIDTINKFAEKHKSLDITFVGDNGQNITIPNVTIAKSVGTDTANRKKGDVALYSNNTAIPVSIKKSNAEYWESADTIFGKQADAIIDNLVKANSVKLTPLDKVRKSDNVRKVKISPEVAVKASPEQTLEIVFGSDIMPHGAIIKQTFHDEHYSLKGNHLTITTDLVIRRPEDIPENLQVYFLIRNDSTRNRPGSKYPGLRVLGSYASRVKNALIVDPDKLPAATTAPKQRNTLSPTANLKPALKVSKPKLGTQPTDLAAKKSVGTIGTK